MFSIYQGRLKKEATKKVLFFSGPATARGRETGHLERITIFEAQKNNLRKIMGPRSSGGGGVKP